MSIEMLEKFATESGNEEILNAVNSVKELHKSNVDRLSFLEKDNKQAIDKRDSIKNLVRTKLGIDDVSEESLSSIASKLSSGQNDNEVKSLSTMLESLKAEKESIESKYNSTVSNYKIDTQFSSLGAIAETEGSVAYNIALGKVKEGAEIDNSGNIVFKAQDGTTIRNPDGSPTTLADRYNQLKDSEEFSFLFKKKKSKAGGGTGGGTSSSIVSKEAEYFDRNSPNFNLTKQAEIFKNNPALYKQIKGQ